MSEKLQKVLARAGLGSRRQIEEWISSGRLMVNNEIATLGARVEITDKIILDGRELEIQPEQMITHKALMYHKPVGEVTTRDDPEGRPTVFDNLPPLRGSRWIVVGRLDINTSGLLLFTNDGELANRLMHPSSEIEREYAVRLFGSLTPSQRKALQEGVMLDDGMARFNSIESKGGTGSNHWYHVTIAEGRTREVRRMFEAVELLVSRLIRVRYGTVKLDPQIRQGGFRLLEEPELDELLDSVGLSPQLSRGDRKREVQVEKYALRRTSESRPMAQPETEETPLIRRRFPERDHSRAQPETAVGQRRGSHEETRTLLSANDKAGDVSEQTVKRVTTRYVKSEPDRERAGRSERRDPDGSREEASRDSGPRPMRHPRGKILVSGSSAQSQDKSSGTDSAPRSYRSTRSAEERPAKREDSSRSASEPRSYRSTRSAEDRPAKREGSSRPASEPRSYRSTRSAEDRPAKREDSSRSAAEPRSYRSTRSAEDRPAKREDSSRSASEPRSYRSTRSGEDRPAKREDSSRSASEPRSYRSTRSGEDRPARREDSSRSATEPRSYRSTRSGEDRPARREDSSRSASDPRSYRSTRGSEDRPAKREDSSRSASEPRTYRTTRQSDANAERAVAKRSDPRSASNSRSDSPARSSAATGRYAKTDSVREERSTSSRFRGDSAGNPRSSSGEEGARRSPSTRGHSSTTQRDRATAAKPATRGKPPRSRS